MCKSSVKFKAIYENLSIKYINNLFIGYISQKKQNFRPNIIVNI